MMTTTSGDGVAREGFETLAKTLPRRVRVTDFDALALWAIFVGDVRRNK